MPRGGPRPNAGRPPGQRNKLTQGRADLAARVLAEGMSPLMVMIECMKLALAEGDTGLALDAASKAAPYMHARLAAIELDLKGITDERLRRLAR